MTFVSAVFSMDIAIYIYLENIVVIQKSHQNIALDEQSILINSLCCNVDLSAKLENL